VDALVSIRLSQAIGRPTRVSTRLGRGSGRVVVELPL
jgi:hypothetical protein